VLLIVAALEQNALVSLVERAASIASSRWWRYTPTASSTGRGGRARVIGVNARNLATLEVDRSLFGRIAPRIPEGIVKIAESGVRGRTTCWPMRQLERTPCSSGRAS